MTVKLDYNHFSGILKLKTNDKEVPETHRLLRYQGKKIQYYLNAHKVDHWQGLIVELQQYLKTEVFTLVFQGRDLDFYDVQLSCQNFPTINLVFEEKHTEVDILRELAMLCHNHTTTKEIAQQFEQLRTCIFDVAVIATMSSGKSTFINSMLGQELLPSKNAACTATITSILDTDDEKPFEVECFNKNGKKIIEKQFATAEKLEKYNDDTAISQINLSGDIRGIYSDKMRIRIFDTPGPNNAQNDNHGEITQTFIDDADHGVIIYLMDATAFGTDDDKELLLQVAKTMKEADKQHNDRVLFVLNKCDALDYEKGETIEELIENARQYLKIFGIEHPNIFPVASELAKIARMNQAEQKLTLAQKRIMRTFSDVIEYSELQYDKYATISPSVQQEIEQQKGQALQQLGKGNKQAECDLMLIYSGIKGIELTIEEYLNKYAFPIQVKKVIDLYDTHTRKEVSIDNAKEKPKTTIQNSSFKVAVVSTVSSGKSTLINSILGQELLPSPKVACTATITSILDTNDQKPFEVECFGSNGQQIIEKQQATLNKLEMYTGDSNITQIKLSGDISSVSSKNLDIELYDIAAPKNARNTDYRQINQAFIADKAPGLIVYLMDATSVGKNDDKWLLEQIADAMEESDNQQSNRFLFVLNKCDALDHEKGETIEKLIENTRAYLATFDIHHANIFPVTAELAKVARMDQKKVKLALSQKRTLRALEDVLEYEELQFDTFATLSSSVRQELEQLKTKALQELEKENQDAEYDLALIYSGVKGIELTIQEHLDNYASSLQIN